MSNVVREPERRRSTILCDRRCSPKLWIDTILRKTRESAAKNVERNLVAAILRLQYPDKDTPKTHCICAQNPSKSQSSDFGARGFSYYIREDATRALLRRSKGKIDQMGTAVLIVPAANVEKARRLAKDENAETRLSILSLEGFVTQSVLSISNGRQVEPFEAMKMIMNEYNFLVSESGMDAIVLREIGDIKKLARKKQLSLSAHKKQSARRAPSSKNPNKWLRNILRFPRAKGKTVESIEFSTELGYHSISISFTDKTSLNLQIEARFIIETDYSDWKTGNQRLLRRWPPVQNLEFRDTL